MKLIVGLGNPEKKYERTRHNAGFQVIDALLAYDRNQLARGKGPFEVNAEPFQGGEVRVAKPTLFMNETGQAVRILLNHFHVSPEDCLVVTDDVNLPIGRIRFRLRGRAGGHHGLESIIAALGTKEFPRLRIGIGSGNLSGRDLTDYVLGRFTKQEWDEMHPQIERARDACLEWVKNGAARVMERFNR